MHTRTQCTSLFTVSLLLSTIPGNVLNQFSLCPPDRRREKHFLYMCDEHTKGAVSMSVYRVLRVGKYPGLATAY